MFCSLALWILHTAVEVLGFIGGSSSGFNSLDINGLVVMNSMWLRALDQLAVQNPLSFMEAVGTGL